MTHSDVVVVGAGLAGLVATAELLAAGRRVTLLDAEPAASLGGQAFWSFGGLFLVDSPEQRRLGRQGLRGARARRLVRVRATSPTTAPTAGAARGPRASSTFAAGDLRLVAVRPGRALVPAGAVGRARRLPGRRARQLGPAVPRHVGHRAGHPRAVRPRAARRAAATGLVDVRFRHRVTGLVTTDGRVTGVRGDVLVPDGVERAVPSSRAVQEPFELVRERRRHRHRRHRRQPRPGPRRRGRPSAGRLPARMLSGVPDHVDGSGIAAAKASGAAVVHEDRMWHYPEGITNHSPVWSQHGIRILAGPEQPVARRRRATACPRRCSPASTPSAR